MYVCIQIHDRKSSYYVPIKLFEYTISVLFVGFFFKYYNMIGIVFIYIEYLLFENTYKPLNRKLHIYYDLNFGDRLKNSKFS